MQLPIVLPDDSGIRPLGKKNKCFYCNREVGSPHKRECVVLSRKVKVKYSYDLEIEVPWHWTQEDIEYHRNASSWCADNSIEELEKAAKEHTCLCGMFSCEVTEIPRVKPYRRNNKDEIVD
jgi:hypothetical protein